MPRTLYRVNGKNGSAAYAYDMDFDQLKLAAACDALEAYGIKTAAPASVLGTALRHGAISAIPGAVIGGIRGYRKAPEGQGLRGALGGAAKGGLITGAIGAAGSGFRQAEYRDRAQIWNDVGAMATPAGGESARARVARMAGSTPETLDAALSGPTWLSGHIAGVRQHLKQRGAPAPAAAAPVAK